MTLEENVSLAMDGDVTAFIELYTPVYKDLFYIAVAALGNTKDAVDVVLETVSFGFKNMIKVKSEGNMKSWLIKLLFTKIVDKFKEWRVNGTKNVYQINTRSEISPLAIQLGKLTDVERMVVIVWGMYGLNENKISFLTGIKETIVVQKLATAQKKLAM